MARKASAIRLNKKAKCRYGPRNVSEKADSDLSGAVGHSFMMPSPATLGAFGETKVKLCQQLSQGPDPVSPANRTLLRDNSRLGDKPTV
jgi:hypothetical protein